MVEILPDEEQIICRFCESSGFRCKEPSVPLIPGRIILDLQGVKVGINFEKMAKCAKRITMLAVEETLREETH